MEAVFAKAVGQLIPCVCRMIVADRLSHKHQGTGTLTDAIEAHEPAPNSPRWAVLQRRLFGRHRRSRSQGAGEIREAGQQPSVASLSGFREHRKWYGASYGWAWPPEWHSVGQAVGVAAQNAALLTGDLG